ncbi:cell division protein ZapD [Limnohabitans parvus]|uniref:Cell division protein ZapD n=1 Tax=Limnohabitans parvus II-B4 TaxID=1293052 RepID=A0A315E4L8_9BURK|nr:cell division protein ZapD [Limnohabitans parvus]PUE52079.1 cell division protein ZapD [Limnohabitans parvus II-B4]
MILYEYPFNERIRTYLRLQQLFNRLGQLMARTEALDHHFALTTLFEIIEVASRSELKSDVLKDLERQKQLYNGYRGNPAISEKALDGLIAQLDEHFESLNRVSGKIGQSLNDNDFLMALRSRAVIPGGTCEFDLPAYYAWQHHDAPSRASDLAQWVAPFAPLAQAIQLLLQMLRESGSSQKVMATAGQLQQNLPQGRTFQLLRLKINPALGITPEISCNRLLVVIRMMHQQGDGKLVATTDDVPFEMSLCA